jgi:hypothetical protein
MYRSDDSTAFGGQTTANGWTNCSAMRENAAGQRANEREKADELRLKEEEEGQSARARQQRARRI